MVPDPHDPLEIYDRQFREKDDLVFLRDEGLEFLALIKRVRDRKRRDLIKNLIEMVVESQPTVDGR